MKRQGQNAIVKTRHSVTVPLLLAGLVSMATCLATKASLAQDTTSKPPATTQPAPSDGVVQPPNLDPGIQAAPPVPSAALPTPVIPPPGTAGGNPTVVPK